MLHSTKRIGKKTDKSTRHESPETCLTRALNDPSRPVTHTLILQLIPKHDIRKCKKSKQTYVHQTE